ncbi:hypothetical protein JRQ81_010740, partial [Phrynocephalus forsythii]
MVLSQAPSLCITSLARLCSCPMRKIKTIECMILTCLLYEAVRRETIVPRMEGIPGRSEKTRLAFLLSDVDPKITCQ